MFVDNRGFCGSRRKVRLLPDAWYHRGFRRKSISEKRQGVLWGARRNITPPISFTYQNFNEPVMALCAYKGEEWTLDMTVMCVQMPYTSKAAGFGVRWLACLAISAVVGAQANNATNRYCCFSTTKQYSSIDQIKCLEVAVVIARVCIRWYFCGGKLWLLSALKVVNI